jgi:ubiquinone/menaquinone biosynthesis C-methylase UbiE
MSWETEASNWIAWARAPGHDSYWRFHRDQFLPSLPAPGRLTVDIGCGEGRLTRDLAALGHRVVGVDVSPTMLAAAREADPKGQYVEADAAKLPFEDGAADLAVAFMSLMDMDDMRRAATEIARVLEPGGVVVAAVVHPLNSATLPRDEDQAAPFAINAYRAPHAYSDSIEREGLKMTFRSIHYSLEDYWRAIRDAGFVVDELREVYDDAHLRWREIPLFLRLDARKPV